MVTNIVLKSSGFNPLEIMEYELKNAKQTDLQFNGLIHSDDPEDNGLRPTRVNKSKLNKIRVMKNDLNLIVIDCWCTNDKIAENTLSMIAKLREVVSEQEDKIRAWEELNERRKHLI